MKSRAVLDQDGKPMGWMGFHADGSCVWMPVQGPVVNMVVTSIIPTFNFDIRSAIVTYEPKPQPKQGEPS